MKDLKSGKESKQVVLITDGKVATRFTDQATAQTTYEKMKEEGKKCFLSRGVIIQFFVGKKKKEIRNLIVPDFDNAFSEEAMTKTGRNIEILNRVEETLK